MKSNSGSSRSFDNLGRQKKGHTGIELGSAIDHTCNFCGKTFLSMELLSDHLVTHLSENLGQFKCDLCEKVFKYSTNRNRHRKSHAGKKHGCKFCGKQFSRTDILKTHMVTRHLDMLK